MTLDIRGSLKNRRSNNYYVVLEELFSNAVDSYLIRKEISKYEGPLKVDFKVDFIKKDLIEGYDLKILCEDNGEGFKDEQVKAFLTKDTSYKDDLKIKGIGNCKGSGRIQFFHYFKKFGLESVFGHEDKKYSRKLAINENDNLIEDSSFIREETTSDIKTTVSLSYLKDKVFSDYFLNDDIRDRFNTNLIKNHILRKFLPRLINLQRAGIEFEITFQSREGTGEYRNLEKIEQSDLPKPDSEKEVQINYEDKSKESLKKNEKFQIAHYKLDRNKYNIGRNAIYLSANSASVKDVTKEYLGSSQYIKRDSQGFYNLIFIESNFLDNRVNEQRDDFYIDKRPSNPELFQKSEDIYWDTIFENLDSIIESMITPPDWNKYAVTQEIENKYGITNKMISEVEVRVKYGDTAESVTTRVLTKFQEKIIKDTSEIVLSGEQIENLNPSDKDFREKVNNLAWKYTTSLKQINMANLSQLVVRRVAIVNILKAALKRELSAQNVNGRQVDEKIIHSVFFPMGQDSTTTKDHDIWLLNEDYIYYDYISSDMQLGSINWDGDKLFESDIDVELQKLLETSANNNSRKRPDIAIFHKTGSVIIIEFKSPSESLDEHLQDIYAYANLIARKSKGKLKKFYGYLVGSKIDEVRMGGRYTAFSDGKGYFMTEPLKYRDPAAGEQYLGEIYQEVIFYDHIVEKAEKRLEVFKQKLEMTT